jgi:hypothetical protein
MADKELIERITDYTASLEETSPLARFGRMVLANLRASPSTSYVEAVAVAAETPGNGLCGKTRGILAEMFPERYEAYSEGLATSRRG